MRDRRALVELAFLVPWIGFVLLTPPVLARFSGWEIGPLPALLVYVFVGWIALIAASFVLARALAPAGRGPDGDGRRPREP